MMRLSLIILIISSLVYGCRKTDSQKLSGTVTIDNTLYGEGPYYALGFSFSSGKKISTLKVPAPDITIEADAPDNGILRKLYLSTNNFENSFYRVGEYPDAATALSVFKNLTSVGNPSWESMGNSIKSNQVWIFRTGNTCYAKLRIMNTIGEIRQERAYAECTFEWVYQPNGSLVFP